MRQRGGGRVRAREGVAFADLIEQLIGGQIAQLGGERRRQALRGGDVQRQIVLPIDLGDDGQLHHAAAGEGHVGIEVQFFAGLQVLHKDAGRALKRGEARLQ